MISVEESIVDLTQMVWETALGMSLSGPLPPLDHPVDWSVHVDISGAWVGTISLYVSKALGHLAAEAMLAPEPVGEEEPLDVTAELANMIAGDFKGLLEGENALSIPRVESGGRVELPPGSVRFGFACQGAPFSVTVARCSTD